MSRGTQHDASAHSPDCEGGDDEGRRAGAVAWRARAHAWRGNDCERDDHARRTAAVLGVRVHQRGLRAGGRVRHRPVEAADAHELRA